MLAIHLKNLQKTVCLWCPFSRDPWDVFVFQVRCEEVSELVVCFRKMCFDGAFAPVNEDSNLFDGKFLNVSQEEYLFTHGRQMLDGSP